jgi:hypothetical protein
MLKQGSFISVKIIMQYAAYFRSNGNLPYRMINNYIFF